MPVLTGADAFVVPEIEEVLIGEDFEGGEEFGLPSWALAAVAVADEDAGGWVHPWSFGGGFRKCNRGRQVPQGKSRAKFRGGCDYFTRSSGLSDRSAKKQSGLLRIRLPGGIHNP